LGLNILWFNWKCIRHPQAGGAEVYTHEIARRLVARGHRVTLVTSRPPGLPEEEVIDGVRIVRRGGRLGVYLWAYRMYRWLTREEKYDLVVDEVNTIPFMTPLYVREPVFMLIHQLCKDCYKDYFHPVVYPFGWTVEKLLHKLYARYTRKGRVRRVITVSRDSMEDLVSLGYPPDRIEIVYNGLDLERIRAHCPREKKYDKLAVYIGRVSRYKRLEDLLEAWRLVEERVPEARLVVAGRPNPKYKARLEDLARRLGLERAEIRGPLREEEKYRLLGEAGVFAYTSRREGWGRSVLEAAACGVPAVAYNVPGLREAVVHGRTGLLVELGDVEGLGRAISRLLLDVGEAARMGREAREYASRFTWEESARRFEEILLSHVG